MAQEARYAADYGAGVISASTSVLTEIIRSLGEYNDSLVLLGGWAPYYLLQKFQNPGNQFTHVGSIDIDLAVHPSLIKEGKYASIVEILTRRGYTPKKDKLEKEIEFSFLRTVKSKLDQKEYVIELDFLSAE